MSAWRDGAWRAGSWRAGSWRGLGATAVVVDGPRRGWRGLMKMMVAQGTTVEQVSGNPDVLRWVAPK